MDKKDLVIQALEERIAQIVTSYERQMADFRADATIRFTGLEAEIKRLREESRQPSEASEMTIPGRVINVADTPDE